MPFTALLTLMKTDSSRLILWPDQSSSPWAHRAVLLAVGILAFLSHLDGSLLEGSEGLYAQIAREMVAAREFFALTFQGEPYINKPPLFFWLLGGAGTLGGETEFALRLPGAVFAAGTMGLTYAFGCLLFSRTAGFWAAVVVATTHVFLWYGPRILFDSTLTFAMTFALFAWVRASMQEASGAWYLAAFASMAMGAMIKSLHAFAMPFAIMMVYSFWQREYRAVTSPWFWTGFALYWVITGVYASWLPDGMQGHFDLRNVLQRAFDFSSAAGDSSARPLRLHWYLSMMWFDFFPWSALIPAATLLMIAHEPGGSDSTAPDIVRKPQKGHAPRRFLLLWFWGYLFMLSVSQFKREPYLMPLVPALGLMVGYYYQAIGNGYREKPWVAILTLVMLVLLAIAFVAALALGPILLQRKWYIPFPAFPPWYILGLGVLCLVLSWSAVTSRKHLALATVGWLALGFVVGVVMIILPTIDRFSPKQIDAELRATAARLEMPLFYYGIAQEDLIFYLRSSPPVPRLESLTDVNRQVARHCAILVVTDYRHVDVLSRNEAVAGRVVRTFPMPRGRDFSLVQIGPSEEPSR